MAISHKQEKAMLRTAYRQSCNRFKASLKTGKKTGSGGKSKQLGSRGTTTLMIDAKGHKTWRRSLE